MSHSGFNSTSRAHGLLPLLCLRCSLGLHRPLPAQPAEALCIPLCEATGNFCQANKVHCSSSYIPVACSQFSWHNGTVNDKRKNEPIRSALFLILFFISLLLELNVHLDLNLCMYRALPILQFRSFFLF